ncbi:MAG: thiamine pyrophosphate-dependent enzyme [Rhodobacteraceae bacterium]|nr:thiamine pyrophosphate-dependent enzyme [Paracoccaceae bacterium]
MDRAEIVHVAFLARLAAGDLPDVAGLAADAGLKPDQLRALFRAQVTSRHLDRMSRKMQAKGQGFYTIGSSGHEGNGAVALALRPTDPAFLHYRDGAFQIARAGQVAGQDMIRDMLLSFACAVDDPISGGRHKVLGSKALNIPPQTSTIASHLPKAVGAAYSIALARRAPPSARQYEPDAVAICSFGDASLNHSTAQGALNSAGWTAWQNAPLPLIFLCQDNGIGISTKSPKGWVSAVLQSRPGLSYMACNGLDVVDTYRCTRAAADMARRLRKPVVIHMSCVRLYGHAGPDVESAYRPMSEIEAAERNDPLIHTAARLISENLASTEEITKQYQTLWRDIEHQTAKVVQRPHLKTSDQVMASLIPPKRAVQRRNAPSDAQRVACFGAADMRALDAPQPMNKLINLGLQDLMLAHPEIVMMGEDIGLKGGVYGVTKGLQSKFGKSRMIDTLLDEQSILGLALGLAQNGFLSMPEIQFLAYLHNAEDQLRGEAATLPFFSNGQFTNPMVLRIAGLGYQKGFGGHFHNDNSLAVLRDIPGLIIGCPSDGADAVCMYREAVRLAHEEQRIVVMIDPIALYPMRDLHEPGDGGWMRHYPGTELQTPLGAVGVEGQGTDLAIVTYGNGRYLSNQAKPVLTKDGINLRIIDMRWLAPLAETAILAATRDCDHILIVDECRHTGSQSEALMALFGEAGRTGVVRITARDSFIATGPAYGVTLPSVDRIVEAGKKLVCAGAS